MLPARGWATRLQGQGAHRESVKWRSCGPRRSLGRQRWRALPADAPDLGAGTTTSAEGWCTLAKTILLVEDDHDTRTLLTTALKEAGYAVVEAADGRQGLERARSVPVDLILLDIMMPVMSGDDALAALKAYPVTAAIPVIAISAKGTAQDIEEAGLLGVSSYITKPFRIAEVLHTITAFI